MEFDLKNKIYVMIDNHWFDLTNYIDHPGGMTILKKYHLKDCTKEFNSIKGHEDAFALSKLNDLLIKNTFLIIYLNLIKKSK